MPSVLEIRPTLNTTGSAGQQNTSLGSWPVGNCRKFQFFSFILKIPMSSCTMKYPNCPFTDVFWHPKEWDPLTFTNDPDPPALQLHFLFHALHLIQARCQCKAADPREENHGPWSFFGWPWPMTILENHAKLKGFSKVFQCSFQVTGFQFWDSWFAVSRSWCIGGALEGAVPVPDGMGRSSWKNFMLGTSAVSLNWTCFCCNLHIELDAFPLKTPNRWRSNQHPEQSWTQHQSLIDWCNENKSWSNATHNLR